MKCSTACCKFAKLISLVSTFMLSCCLLAGSVHWRCNQHSVIFEFVFTLCPFPSGASILVQRGYVTIYSKSKTGCPLPEDNILPTRQSDRGRPRLKYQTNAAFRTHRTPSSLLLTLLSIIYICALLTWRHCWVVAWIILLDMACYLFGIKEIFLWQHKCYG